MIKRFYSIQDADPGPACGLVLIPWVSTVVTPSHAEICILSSNKCRFS